MLSKRVKHYAVHVDRVPKKHELKRQWASVRVAWHSYKHRVTNTQLADAVRSEPDTLEEVGRPTRNSTS